jgi:hypothetical protein
MEGIRNCDGSNGMDCGGSKLPNRASTIYRTSMLNHHVEEQQAQDMLDHAFGYILRIDKHVLYSSPSHLLKQIL